MLAAGEEEARRAQGNFAPIVKVEHSLDASFIPHSGAYCPFDMDVSRRNLTHKQTKIILPRHVLKAKHTLPYPHSDQQVLLHDAFDSIVF